MYCHWLIAPKLPYAGSIILDIAQFSLESGYDFLNITDGKGTLLGAFTGSKIPPTIMSSTGILEVTFRSDATSHARGYGYSTSVLLHYFVLL